MEHDEICLGPPCEHFPEEVKTATDALDYLAVQALSLDIAVHYVKNCKIQGRPRPRLTLETYRKLKSL